MNESTEQFIKDAFQTLYAGGQDEAKAAAETLIKQNNINGYNLLSECFLIDQDIPKAQAVVQKALELFPDNWQLWMKKANIETTMNDFDSAHNSYKKALEFDASDSELINLNITVLFCKENKLDEALNHIQNSQRGDYESEFTSLRYKILFSQGKYSDMISAYEEEFGSVEDLNQEDIFVNLSEIYFYTGKAYNELGINEKAKKLMLQAVRTDFRNNEAMEIYRELCDNPSENAEIFMHQIKRDHTLIVSTLAESDEESIEYIKEIFGSEIDIAESTKVQNSEKMKYRGLVEIQL